MIALADPSPTDEHLCRRGETIASYVLGDVLGVGGMGVVYSATQRSLDRQVALKVPRPELANDAVVRAQLRSEAFAGAALNHRNIVHVLDFGTAAGVPFVVMERVAGPRLSQVLAETGHLPVARALELVRQIVDGLEDAHTNGIVHADVKCDNVLLETRRDDSVVPRLIDFGIARFTGEAPPRTGEAPTVTGTAEYLPPEVICGEPPSYAADVYAIGVVLYELVTGTTPFSGATSAQVMCRRLEDEVVPTVVRCPDRNIPTAFDAVVMRALARDPADRFPDAQSLGVALDALAEHIPSTSTVTPRHRSQISFNSADDALVVDCLTRSRELIGLHRLPGAIAVLEQGIARLAQFPRATAVWRLQLALAALYDGVGNRSWARATAREARESARRAGSDEGCDRADELSVRLSQRRTRTRRSGWWR